MKKQLEKIAKKIIKCEKAIRRGENVEANEVEIERLTNQLSINDMLEIDEYIMEHIDN